MRIAVIGTGYVGLVSGTCFAELGFSVTCVDVNPTIIDHLNQGKVPIFEPGLEFLINKNVKAGRLSFTTDLAGAVHGKDLVFIAVGTPPKIEDGSADLSYVMAAGKAIAKNIQDYTVVVTKSTVPVDTHHQLAMEMHQANPKAAFDVVSNPEFLREGCAIEDFLHPDRVVIGSDSERATAIMRKLYEPLAQQNVPLVFTTPVSAELIKYASNCFLATKISFINEMADLCEKTGAHIQEVARGIGLDSRIGSRFLNVGPGYGGSCFPKDTYALLETAKQYEVPLAILKTVVGVNEARKEAMARRVIAHAQGVKGKKIAVLGVTFKADTDDIRDSPALVILSHLQQEGAVLSLYDPEGMSHAKKLWPDLHYGKDAYEVLEGAEVLVVLTEWNEFKSLDFSRVKQLMRRPLVMDFRNLYNPKTLHEAGLIYVPLGTPLPKQEAGA